MLENVVFQVHHGEFPSDEQNGVAVIKHTNLIRGQKLSTADLIVGGIVSASPGTLSVSVCVDGFLAQQFAHIFVGGLLVATQVEELIAVADDGFPLLFKQCLELCQVLKNDGHKHTTGTHNGKDLIEVVRQADIGELVHQEVNRNRQCAAVNMVSGKEKLLK